MKMLIFDLKKVSDFEKLDTIVSNIDKDLPDVVVFLGYSRNMQERVLHPLQKSFKSSSSESTEDILVITRTDFKGEIPFIDKYKDLDIPFVRVEI